MVANGPNVVEPSQTSASKWAPTSWPLRWKVAAIMVLPVVLAMTFGAVRINGELSDASKLSIAANNVGIVAPAVAFVDAANELAYAGATGNGIGDASSKYDTAAATFAALVKSGDFDATVAGRLSAAEATAATLRSAIGAGDKSPAKLAEQAESISSSVSEAITATMRRVNDDQVRAIADSLVTALSAQRALETQRVLITSPGFSDDVALRVRVASAAGREAAAVDLLSQQVTSTTIDATSLRSAVDLRREAYGRPGADGITAGTFASAALASDEEYSQLTGELSTSLSETVTARSNDLRSAALRDTAIVLGAVLVALALALSVGRSLVRSISRLRHGALQVARLRLPEEIERLRSGEGVPEIEPIPVHTTEEIGQLARAVDDIHFQALRLAGEHGQRLRIGDMFETLSRRSRSLVEEQLALIETLERDEDDPERLDRLFRLDHLTTRMRRNGDNLLVLADTTERRGRLDPVPVADVLRAGMSEVEDYRRVDIGPAVDGSLTGAAAADIGHLIAELIDNALRFSPPDTAVAVTTARAVDAGILIEVADRGLGMSNDELRAANERLSLGGEVTPETARRMGLFVVGRLARRHNITVRLRTTAALAGQPGVTASVHVPGVLIAPSSGIGGNDRLQERPSRLSAFADQRDDSTAPSQSLAPAVNGATAAPASFATPDRNGDFATANGNTNGRSLPGLPRRSPGASGVRDETKFAVNGNAFEPSPIQDSRIPENGNRAAPSNTSAFFGARNGAEAPAPVEPADGWPKANFPQPRLPGQPEPEPAPPRQTAAAPAPRVQPEPVRPAPPARQAPQPAPRQPSVLAPVQNDGADSLPIFARLTSEWLMDPSTSGPSNKPWVSAADAGWSAAQQASESKVERHTESGLPVRERGARLVPGVAMPTTAANGNGNGNGSKHRDPAAVRANLSRQLAGVRNGRARTEEGRHSSHEGDR